jgi:hypothetical protein
MLAVLPFSQSNPVYISSTLLPSCLLLNVEEGDSFPSNKVVRAGLFGPFEIVADRIEPVDIWPLGVREAELEAVG